MVGVDGVRATSDVEVAHDVSAEIAHGCRDEALGAPALGVVPVLTVGFKLV